MTSEYFVKLDQFEGPLDLLLYLIRVHELDVFQIDIFKLTTQYLNYLRHAGFADLNDASAFIEMAASLIEIKTHQLLPQNRGENESEQGNLNDDPAEQLKQRLLEYARFQNAAHYFEHAFQEGLQIITASEWERLSPIYEHIESPIKGDSASLVLLFEQIIRDLAERNPSIVEAKFHLITLEETLDMMVKYMETVEFLLFQGMYEKFQSRYDFVVHLLAVLELCKSGYLATYQERLMGPLWVYLRNSELSKMPFFQRQGATGDSSLAALPQQLDEDHLEATLPENTINPAESSPN